ncbi:MAG: hypothetical protein AB2L09_11885 [Coriobacteriia bacterium]
MKIEQERQLSTMMVRMVQVLFAVVLGQSLLLYREAVVNPFRSTNWLLLLALITIYLTTILSWIDWHRSVELNPYQIATTPPPPPKIFRQIRTLAISGLLKSLRTYYSRLWQVLREYSRIAIDLLIVATYARMVLTANALQYDPRTTLLPFLVNLPAIFVLYLAAGYLRRGTYGRRASRTHSLWMFFALNTALVIGYWALHSLRSPNATLVNAVALALAAALMLVYRLLARPWESSMYKRKKRASGRTVGVDIDGVLADQIDGILPTIRHKYGLSLQYGDITHWRLDLTDGANIADEIELALGDDDYITQMPVHAGARQLLECLDIHNTLMIVTARNSSANRATDTWLRHNGLPFDDILHVYPGKKSLTELNALIDDYLGNIDGYLSSTNGIAVLVNQPWNQDRANVQHYIDAGRLHVAQDLSEVQKVLCKLGFSAPTPPSPPTPAHNRAAIST